MVIKGRGLPLLSVPPPAFRACTSPSTGEVTVAFFMPLRYFAMSLFLVAMLALVVRMSAFRSRTSRAYCRFRFWSYVSSISFCALSRSACWSASFAFSCSSSSSAISRFVRISLRS